MARPLRIGLYSPFLGSTIGGGEKYFGVTAEAIRDAFPGATVDIITPVPVDRALYEQMLDLDLSGIRFLSTNRRITPLHRILNSAPTLRLYRDLFIGAQAVRLTREYDLYLAMVYVIPIFSHARRSIMLCQFPYRPGSLQRRVPGPIFWLYSLPYRLLKPLMLGDEVASFDDIICQSQYVRHWVNEYWKRDPLVINPPIDIPTSEPRWGDKQRMILSVGRFFKVGHNKRQDFMVKVFRELCDEGLTGWEFHLAGSVHRESHNAGYFESVQEMARGYPIFFHPDAPYAKVQDLYDRASIYWHAAGYQADAEADPSTLEHFGMTTAEAMGHGVVPVVIASGGQPEVVRDRVDGFLWEDGAQLKRATLDLVKDREARERFGAEARRSAQRFSRAEFKRKMIDCLRPAVAALDAKPTRHPGPSK